MAGQIVTFPFLIESLQGLLTAEVPRPAVIHHACVAAARPKPALLYPLPKRACSDPVQPCRQPTVRNTPGGRASNSSAAAMLVTNGTGCWDGRRPRRRPLQAPFRSSQSVAEECEPAVRNDRNSVPVSA